MKKRKLEQTGLELIACVAASRGKRCRSLSGNSGPPVQGPTRYRMVINLKAAKALGLTIMPDLIAAADQVIE